MNKTNKMFQTCSWLTVACMSGNALQMFGLHMSVDGWACMDQPMCLDLDLLFPQFSNALALVKPTIVCRVINHVFV